MSGVDAIKPPTYETIARFLEDLKERHIQLGKNLPHVIVWYDKAIALMRAGNKLGIELNFDLAAGDIPENGKDSVHQPPGST